jgi:DNA-binding response OmpR family regulator
VARILIADDSTEVRRLLAATLAHDGHHVSQAADGRRAFEVLTTEPFEVAILDVMMPGVDGLTLCRMLRDAQGLGHLAIIVISGTTSEMAALAAGADLFLSKPFLPSTLLNVVTSLSGPMHNYAKHGSPTSREARAQGHPGPAAGPAAHYCVSADGVH